MSRQNYLQRNQAAHIINLLAQSMGGGSGTPANRHVPQGANVPADELFAMMGVEIEE